MRSSFASRDSESTDADRVIRFEVSDTGDGIAPEMLRQVFQPFVQADTSTSRRYGGTGLGLAISSQLVSLMGGDCGVDSELGSGSAFWFTICVHTDAATDRDESVAPDPDLRGVSVLVVDDSAALRIVLSDQLADWGMNVAIAGTGEAGLALLRAAAADHTPFRAALLDRSMPGMDGVELKSAVVADPNLSPGLVLMLGLGEERDLGPVEDSGVSASLFKPIHLTELRTCLRVALGLQPPRRHRARSPRPASRRPTSRVAVGCCSRRTTSSTRRSRSRSSPAPATRSTRCSMGARRCTPRNGAPTTRS